MRLTAADRALLIAATEVGRLRAGDPCSRCNGPLEGRLDSARIVARGQVVHAHCAPRPTSLRARLTGRFR